MKTMTMLRLVALVVGLACLCAGEQEALRGGAKLDGSAGGSAGSGSDDAGSGSDGQGEAAAGSESEAAGSESEAAESAGSESEAHAIGKSGSEGEEAHHGTSGSSGSSGSSAPRPQLVQQQTPVVVAPVVAPVVAETSEDMKAEERSVKKLRASLIAVRKSNAEERAGKVSL
jgi:hypothetical protein